LIHLIEKSNSYLNNSLGIEDGKTKERVEIRKKYLSELEKEVVMQNEIL